jgi:hypothetical protein
MAASTLPRCPIHTEVASPRNFLEAVFPPCFARSRDRWAVVDVVEEADGEERLRESWWRRWRCCDLTIYFGLAMKLREVAEYCEDLDCFESIH